MRLVKLVLVVAGAAIFSAFSTKAGASVLYVANTFRPDNIVAFNTSGAGAIFTDFGENVPGCVAFDSSGNLYVGILNEVNGEDYIEKFNSAGVGTTFTTDVLEPSGLAFNSTGNLYVSNLETNTIEAFTPSGVESVFADTHMNSPAALAFNATGTLYVADAGNIVEFSPSGVGTNFSSLVGATGLAFNATGTLFAGNQDGYIFECNSTGVYTHFVRMAVGEEPVGLAFNSAGDLFVTTNENTIVEYSPDGVGTVFADSNLSVPGALAFDPVPEPGTSGLLAGALGALLAASRRRCRGFRRFLMGGCRVFPPNSLDDCEKRKDWAEVEGAG